MTKRIMCIDDDKFYDAIFQYCLGDEFTYKFISDESKAVEECVNFDPNVIFLDLNFPNSDGLTLKQEIESAGVMATFIFISADERSSKIDDMIKAADCGFLRKPLSCDDIAATARFAAALNKILRFSGGD